ncbi:hypothetical protein QTP88_002391 [Uroleucon formosanum]
MLERAAYSPETMCSRSPSFRQPPAAVVTQAPVERECGPTVTRVSVVVVSAITISLSLRLSPSSSPSSQSLVYDKVVHVLVRVSSAPSQYTRARPMEQLLFNEVLPAVIPQCIVTITATFSRTPTILQQQQTARARFACLKVF